MLGYELGLVNLLVEAVGGGGVVAQLVAESLELVVYRAALHEHLVGHAHHDGERLHDGAVEREHDKEREHAPEAAAEGADLVLAVETGHFLVELLGVALVLLLQLHHARLQPAHAHHALLALRHEGQQHERDDNAEQNDGPAEVVGQVVEDHHQPAKGGCYCIKHFLLAPR